MFFIAFQSMLLPSLGLLLIVLAGIALTAALTHGDSTIAKTKTAFVFVGIVLILVGVVALLSNMHLISPDWQKVWSVAWPIAIVVFGVALIIESLRGH